MMKLKNKILTLHLILIAFIAMTSCHKELVGKGTDDGTIVKIMSDNYDGESLSRSVKASNTVYDFMRYYIMDDKGKPYNGAYSVYYPETSEIKIDGLKEGNYTLLVLGIKGNHNEDKATVRELNSINDLWISFPKDLSKPLCADYYFSSTPFSVSISSADEGMKETINLPSEIKQKRIVGRVDFDFNYDNPYLRTALTNNTAIVRGVKYYTEFYANNVYKGSSDEMTYTLNLIDDVSYRFLPTYAENEINGDVTMDSKSYIGKTYHQQYSYKSNKVSPNKINHIIFDIVHPEGNSGVMYYTLKAYEEAKFKKILQDDEPSEVYTNEKERFFNTAKPLQMSFDENGQFHMRFYSPRNAGDMKVMLKMPEISNEFLDFAYFDTIPAFADIYVKSPVLNKSVTLRTESGKVIQVPQLTAGQLADAEIKIASSDSYWKKLASLKYGRNLSFNLYGGDPEAPDGGGGTTNWMGIRPVHCREAIAFFINYTYMVGMEKLENLIKAHPNDLWDDEKKPVTPEKALELMRKEYTMKVGLVSTRNGVAGMASPSVFGVYQDIYFTHYNSTYATEIFFHELGHSYGFFGHSSSFTLGPWAWTLMNHFYVDNIKEFPIDSPKYLDSWNNPCIYRL